MPPTILNTQSIYYDDVNLIAQPQNFITSRKEIPVELNRIIVAPMQSVVGEAFALEALSLGLQVCLPRFLGLNKQVEIWENTYAANKDWVDRLWISFGLENGSEDEASELISILALKHKKENVNILLDVANGYLRKCVGWTNFIHHNTFNAHIMAGNIHSARGLNLYKPGTYVRTGIGQGSVCKTSQVTGFSRGQITEIAECYDARMYNISKIIADGGVRDSGCAIKAFGAGADYVMMGGYFSKAAEAQNVIDGEYNYWGGASHKQQVKERGCVYRHSEGAEKSFDRNETKPLETLVSDLWGGISSGVSYSGYKSLSDFIGNGVFEIKK